MKEKLNFSIAGAAQARHSARQSEARMTINVVDQFKKIETLELELIKFKLMDPGEGDGWSLVRATAAEREYRRFLRLNLEECATIVSSKEIDRFWYHHVLDASKYAEDCRAIFGRLLHHFPYFGLRDADDVANLDTAFERAKEQYHRRFGKA